MNVRDVAERAAHAYADSPAVVSGDTAFTFAECWRRAVRFANALLAEGIRPGDHVAVLEKNSIRSVDFYLGAAIAGIVRVPLYWRNSVPLHVAMMTNADCTAAVIDSDAGHEVVDRIRDASGVARVLVRDETYEPWLAGQSDVDPRIPVGDDDLCLIRHTGGTTGQPKGITSTHRQWLCIGRDVCAFKPRIVPGDTMLHVAPLSHASGYYFMPAWAEGARQVLLSDADAVEILGTLARENVTFFFLPPTLLDMIVRAGQEGPRQPLSLKCLAIGSSPISRRTLTQAREFFGEHVLYQTYGTSEAVPISGMGPESWFAELDDTDPLLSAGRPLPYVDFDLRDEDGRSVAVGELGEVTVKCDGMTSGYYRAEEDTAETFVDGWLRTGDVGRLDRHGYLYLVDRIGEMIVSGGHNIYPGDLERSVGALPDVIEVAAFGVPDEKWGETPAVVCRTDSDARLTTDAVRAVVSRDLGSYMKPSWVEFTGEALPRSAVGKIARRTVREDFLSRHGG